MIFKKNIILFTLLELLIAVMIFLIVSVIVATVFRTTIHSYRKGTEHTELTQSLSGTFMLMESDLSNLVAINDEEYVYFKPEEFSFIATGEGNSFDKDYTYLQVIKYSIDETMNMLFKYSARYPDDVDHLDDEPVLFLENLDETKFEYMYKKEKKKEDEDDADADSDKDKDKESIDASEQDDNSEISDKDDSDSAKEKDIKIPIGIKASGKIYSKNRKIGEYFQTTVMVPYFVIQKSTDSDSGKDDDKDSKDKNKDKDKKD